MKNVLIALFVMGSISLAIGQHDPINDPTYSVNNYKHPNKAAYAKKHSKNKEASFKVTTVSVNENYKQPYSKESTSRATIPSSKIADRTKDNYKHPHGL